MNCKCCGAWFSSSDTSQELCVACRRALARVSKLFEEAVHVVRCKDCKHFNVWKRECENDAVSTDHEGGASYSLNFDLDDYCSYGERKMDLEE